MQKMQSHIVVADAERKREAHWVEHKDMATPRWLLQVVVGNDETCYRNENSLDWKEEERGVQKGCTGLVLANKAGLGTEHGRGEDMGQGRH